MTSVQGSGFRVPGARVLRALLLAVLATAVLPPAGAWWLNARRVSLTTDRIIALVPGAPRAEGDEVICGPGRLPDADVRGADATHAAWLSAAVSRPAAFGPGMPTDAWGRCFLMNDRWLLSAGPNGVVETPFGAEIRGGDDLGARLR